MKKFFCVLLSCFLLTGCTPSENGPSPKEGKQTAVRLARIGGDLYYDTGEENTKVTCGTIERILKKGAEPFSVPTEDGTVNFDGVRGYQNFADDAKTVFTKDGIYIFKKIDTNRDISHYTYACTVSGTLPSAERESTLLVLTKDDSISFQEAANALLSSNTASIPDAYVVPVLSYINPFGVRLSVSNITPSGLTLTITQSGGIVTGTLQTGLDYKLERLGVDGWRSVEYIAEPIFHSLAKLIPTDGSMDMDISWQYHFGELPKGQYRLTKNVWDYRGPANFDSVDFTVTFEIL